MRTIMELLWINLERRTWYIYQLKICNKNPAILQAHFERIKSPIFMLMKLKMNKNPDTIQCRNDVVSLMNIRRDFKRLCIRCYSCEMLQTIVCG